MRTDRALNALPAGNRAPFRAGLAALCLAALCLAGGFHAIAGEGPSPAPAAGTVVRGRLVDGTALARGVKPEDLAGNAEGGDPIAAVVRMPLANRKFRLHVTAGPDRGRSFEGTTDGEGRFALPLAVRGLPGEPCLVAGVEGTPPLYSAAVSPSADELEFRAYQTTESDRILRGSVVHVFHSLVMNPVSDRHDLEVRVQLQLFNASGEMYVGRPSPLRFWKGNGNPPREVLRVPVPAEASIISNTGARGARWSEHPGDGSWKWMVIDTPILPYTERSAGGFEEIWELTYRLPARQETVCLYPLGLRLSVFAAWWREEDMTLESARLRKTRQRGSLRAGEPPQECLVLFSQEEEDLRPGTELPLGIHVDSAKLGEVNRGSLLVVAAFALTALAAILIGLFLGRKGPSLEKVLEEASGEELIARIAELDRLHQENQIPREEYNETRAKLVSMARYLVPELADAAPPGRSGGAPAGPEAAGGLPGSARELLDRLKNMEAEGPLDAHRIHERALLLEELARVLTARADGREKKPREDPR